MIKPISCATNNHKYIYIRNNKESFIQYRVCRDCGKLQERYYEFHKPVFIDSDKFKFIRLID